MTVRRVCGEDSGRTAVQGMLYQSIGQDISAGEDDSWHAEAARVLM